MCGIVYKHSFDGTPVNNDILQQFDKQRARGTQGFGLFDGQEMNMVRSAGENKILKWLVKYNSNLIMFHHRFPTSTANVKRAAHPLSTKDYFGDTQYVMVHNGIIKNAYDLYEKHQELGIEYHTLLDDWSFNDSESLLWDFALYNEGKQDKMESIGNVAFICLKIEKGKLEKMYFTRNSRPLNMKRTLNSVELSSEGEGTPIEPDTLYTFNYRLKRLTTKDLAITEYEPYTGSYTGSYYDYEDWQDEQVTRKYYQENGWNYEEEEDGSYTGVPSPYPVPYQMDKASTWLDDKVTRKFQDYFDRQAKENKSTVIEYQHDPLSQKLVAVETVTPAWIEANWDDLQPTATEVQNEAMAYLASVKGHFEQAYWALEVDIEEAESRPTTLENIKHQILLENVMEWISYDPEYENAESVSSTWRVLWQQELVS